MNLREKPAESPDGSEEPWQRGVGAAAVSAIASGSQHGKRPGRNPALSLRDGARLIRRPRMRRTASSIMCAGRTQSAGWMD
jgi:hypothetical protein